MDDLLGPQIIAPEIPQILLGDVEYRNIFMGEAVTFEGG